MHKLSDYVMTAEMLGVSHYLRRKWARKGKFPMGRNPPTGYRLFKEFDLDKCWTETAEPVKAE